MARAFAVDTRFTAGVWTYTPGEVLSLDDLTAGRGLSADDVAFQLRRGCMREITSVEDLEHEEGRAAFDDAARERALTILTEPTASEE